ncbi:MAG: YlmH/Sll1252 family protein [Absicoccus porci]|uniref:YlmH/Sll1252 family protein n=1 Tax=Absicoccus porci TaxID=2486576 RepID=UPI0023521780|nr:YlmH/Sll1252 family protein [Absicoccus porci]MCI6087285.1 YlmH/Sll1252 family protein [Absicoccus porci]MDD7329763.1 YlmH/Sll1252 family protein [Absicoccus porci]MDY4738420.1 YlmH/Sll1252 family protein [Absicoccus porci]
MRYQPVVTSFLTPSQAQMLPPIVGKSMFVYMSGGYAQAQRKVACISPYELENVDYFIDCLVSKYDARYKVLRHPDVLGALLHLGIERDQLGDILVNQEEIVLFCTSHMADFIMDACIKIGRCPIHFEIDNAHEVQGVSYEEIRVNCSSLRMDTIVAQLAHCSRTKASKMIASGLVKLNDVVLEENGQLCDNDYVSIRKVGRFQFKEVVATSKKNRLILRFLKFQ